MSTLIGILLPAAICAITLGCSRDSMGNVWSAAELAENYDTIKKSDAYPVEIKSGGYFVRTIDGKNIKPPTPK
jgi:hypothetical protein